MTLPRRATLLGLTALVTARGAALAVAAAPTESRFVVVILRGAMDGLSAVVPYGDPGLAALRSALVPPMPGQEKGLLDLGGMFGLHPALARSHAMYQANELLAVHAVAGNYRARSHFEAQDCLESGADRRMASGWLNRVAAALPRATIPLATIPLATIPLATIPLATNSMATNSMATNSMAAQTAPVPAGTSAAQGPGTVRTLGLAPSRAIAVGPSVPLLLRGAEPVANWAPHGFAEPDQPLYQAILNLNRADPVTGPAIESGLRDRGFGDQVMGGTPGGRYGFPALAAAAGAMLRDSGGPRIAALELGGWDTHTAQANRMVQPLTQLDAGLDAMRIALGEAWARTVVLVVTEFGRTARMNGTQGTDHGTATAAFVAGGAVAGGKVVATWPGLGRGQLFEDRDLAPTTDIRAVAQGILAAHLGLGQAGLDMVFPGGGPVQPLRGLVRAV